jgi:hypothetical protein
MMLVKERKILREEAAVLSKLCMKHGLMVVEEDVLDLWNRHNGILIPYVQRIWMSYRFVQEQFDRLFRIWGTINAPFQYADMIDYPGMQCTGLFHWDNQSDVRLVVTKLSDVTTKE